MAQENVTVDLKSTADVSGFDKFEASYNSLRAAKEQHIAAVLAALRAGRPPMKVAELSPFTDTHLRQLAREAGIPPAVKGKRATSPA